MHFYPNGVRMEKRYQVFVSSTFEDLSTGRKKVSEAILQMEHFPAGMEIFPASDESQWEFISNIISECDYYVIIVGGRYGSCSPNGVGYTEMEFDFAIEREIPIIALVHDDPENLDKSLRETTTEQIERFRAFREKVTASRLVKFWSSQDELGGLVALSLFNAVRRFPREGWVRSSNAASEAQLKEVSELLRENKELKAEISVLRASLDATKPPAAQGLADLDDEFEFAVIYENRHSQEYHSTVVKSWREIWMSLEPIIRLGTLGTYSVRKRLGERLDQESGHYNSVIEDTSFNVIVAQFETLGYMEEVSGIIVPSDHGRAVARESLVVKKS